MNDEHGTSWGDGPDRHRHRPQGSERDDLGDWPDQGASYPPAGYPPSGAPGERDWYPAATQGHDPYGAGGYPPDYDQYQQPGYDQGYPEHTEPRGGYPDPRADSWGQAERGYADPRATYQGHTPDPRAPHGYEQDYPASYDQRGYEQPGYQQPGYEQSGYDPNGYGQNGYDPNGYGQNGHDANGYDANGYNAGGYDANGYNAGGYDAGGYDANGYDANGYGRGYEQPGYGAGGHGQAGYPDPGYDPGAGYPGGGYQTASYQQQGGQGGSFIENGFGEADAQAAVAGRRSTGENRRVRGDETDPRARRSTGESRRVRGDETDPHSRGNAGGPPDRPDKPRKTKKKRRGRSLLVLFIVLVMLGGLGVGGYVAWHRFSGYFSTPDYSGSGSVDTVAIKVVKGQSATAIASTLYTKGVVKSTKAFINAADSDPRSRGIQAGWYKLHKQMSGKAALAALVAVDSSGKPVNLLVYTVLVPEGTISIDIFAKLAAATGIPVKEFSDAAKDPVSLGVDPAWFTAPRDDHRASVKSIEGFLYPATYTFQPDEDAKQILTDMVSRFNQEIASLNFIEQAKDHLQIPAYEALIAASIAQVEAGNATDMRGVTRILYNRIYKVTNAGHTLGLDSEVIYWMRINGKPAKTSAQLTTSEINDPKDKYNTHNVPGFPPGAISSPGEDALKAALNPDNKWADYCYFQVVSGKMVYAKTYTQFLAQQK